MKLSRHTPRILHVLVSNKFSGAENIACTIIQNLDHKYTMAYCSPNGPIATQLAERKITFLPSKNHSIRSLRRTIKAFDPDIIHAHDPRASVMASIASPDTPIISHIHCNHPYMQKRSPQSVTFHHYSKKFKKIIWVSQESFSNYIYKNDPTLQNIIIENIVDIKTIQKLAQTKVNCQNLDLVYVGRLSYQKNPERLINIVRLTKNKLPNIKVSIVGDGEMKPTIKDLIQAHGLQHNITLFGFQNNPYPYMNNAKALIMTSRYEGLPMVVLESLAMNKPVISTNIKSLTEIKTNDNIWTYDTDSEAANVIVKILKGDTTCNHINRDDAFRNYLNSIESIYKESMV